jgi:hypothetical protein
MALEEELSSLLAVPKRRLEVGMSANTGQMDGRVREPLRLPPLDQVQAELVANGNVRIVRPLSQRSSAVNAPSFSPRDERRDREVGERGEAIVFDVERRRLREKGLNPDDVVWSTKANPLSNHDIRSVNEDGRPRWIEVKTTVGADGHFRWSRGEFELAMRERSNYFLYRVYHAGSVKPKVKVFQDPVGLLLDDRIRLDVETLRAQIESAKGD